MLEFRKRNPILKFFKILQGPIQRKMSLSRIVGWLSVLWFLSMCASCDFQGCKTTASISGFRFPGHTINTYSEPSIWSCFRSCKLKMPLKCHSINYKLETSQCEINNRTKIGKHASLCPVRNMCTWRIHLEVRTCKSYHFTITVSVFTITVSVFDFCICIGISIATA